MNLLDPHRPLLFRLPYVISSEHQRMILDYAYKHADSWGGQVQVWDYESNQYERTGYFGRLQITRLTEDSRRRLGPEYSTDWTNWAARLDKDLEWEWIDTPITDLVRSYVQQIQHLYQRFHRVLILVQNPGHEIPLHTDKVVRNHYDDGPFVPGPTENLPLSDSDVHWNKNRYLALKWPLTEISGDNGCPIIEINGIIYRYDVGQNCFAINEVDMKHGAGSVQHRRGVIFLDGILDYDILSKEHWIPADLGQYPG